MIERKENKEPGKGEREGVDMKRGLLLLVSLPSCCRFRLYTHTHVIACQLSVEVSPPQCLPSSLSLSLSFSLAHSTGISRGQSRRRRRSIGAIALASLLVAASCWSCDNARNLQSSLLWLRAM